MKQANEDPEITHSRISSSRRDFLLKSAVAIGAMTVPATLSWTQEANPEKDQPILRPGEENAQPFKFGNDPIRRRKSFFDLTDAELQNLCRAIGYMRNGNKKRPLTVDDPLQWDRYVASHAHHCTQEDKYTRVHWSWFFLPWHRAYLFFVERILADILSDVFDLKQAAAAFALPYWDWISHKEIPNTAERASKGVPSPLFGYDLSLENMVSVPDQKDLDFDNLALWDGYRGPTLLKPQMRSENEATPGSKEHVEETISFMTPEFISTILKFSFEDFAGRSTIGKDTGMGVLEAYPHNNGHDWVGSRLGTNRDMGTLRYAALDPIFFMHHANIDRIWSLYRKPQPDPKISPWGAQQYVFVDTTGQPVSVTVRDIIESMNTVQYVAPATASTQTKSLIAMTSAIASEPVKETSEIVVQKSQTLRGKPLTFQSERKPSIKMLFDTVATPRAGTASLLEVTTGPIRITDKFTIRVFVNKPDADAHTSIKDPHYIGRIHALDSEARRSESESASHSFPIILGGADSPFYKIVRPGEPFKITFVPVGTEQNLKDFVIPIKEVRLKVVQ